MCDDNGILLGVNKHNNSLIIVDIFDSRVYKNANIAILGTSGAGKTFTLQLMALRMRRKGIQVFIIAPLKGHEFHRACSNIGGQFISISPASQNCINIMEIRKADKSVDDLLDGPGAEKSLLVAKIQRLHTFFSLLIPDMSHEERQLLDDAMICTYGTKGITHDNASLEQPKHPGRYKEMPILGDLYEILAASPETKRLANILNRLVNGSARSFNQQTNVALDNKYIVLDISELTGDLLTVGMFVALDFVWDKAKENRTAEKAIFVDECWQLIGASSNRQAAESVLELAKTIRGYGGSLVCATQDLNDFFALDDGKYGKGIINNSKTKILLNLEEEEAQRVQGVLHLSEAELMEITHFERGSALISTNNNNIAVEIKCSQMEKELITTDRRELAELAQRAAPKQHEKDGFSGELVLDHTTLSTEASGYTTKYSKTTETKVIGNLDRNDMSYVPATTVKNGKTLTLANVEWQVTGTALVGEALVPAQYQAVATYSASSSYQAATGYVTTAEYHGTVTSEGVDSITYTVVYTGSEIVPVKTHIWDNDSLAAPLLIIAAVLLCAGIAAAALILLRRRKNVYVYVPDSKPREYRLIAKFRVEPDSEVPAIDAGSLTLNPGDTVAVEVKKSLARHLAGREFTVSFPQSDHTYTIQASKHNDWHEFTVPAEEEQEAPV